MTELKKEGEKERKASGNNTTRNNHNNSKAAKKPVPTLVLVPSDVHLNDIEARGGDRISGKKVYHFESPSTKRMAHGVWLDKLLVKNLGTTKEVPVAQEILDAKEKVFLVAIF